jgi:hypothetical protein
MFEDISRFFKSLFSSKAKKKSRFPVLIVIICFLILIPTVFAIFYAYFYDESSQLAANEVQIELYAQPSNKLIATDNVMEANITDSPLISVFNNINITRKPTSKPSDIKAPNFKVIIKHSDKTEEYYCYFNDSEITSFLEDKSGAFFSVDAAAYESLLNSSFSEAA